MQSAIDHTVVLVVAPELRRDPARELRDAWSAGCDAALLAYRSWCEAPRRAKGDAYAAYRAAEEREAAAACALARESAAPPTA